MPLAVYGVALLLLLPPLLMVMAHWYAIAVQDRSVWVVVTLDPQVQSVQHVSEVHARRYHLRIGRLWSSSVKGYTAFAPQRFLDQLSRDQLVQQVDLREPEEF